MEVVRLSDNHKEKYSQFVAAHKSGSFLQSWSWGDFQVTQNKLPIRYGVFDNAKLIATIQLLRTKVPKLPGSYVYAPYGPLISEEAAYHEIIPVLLEQLKKDFVDQWFIRIEPKDDLPIDGKPSVHIQPGSSFITDLTVSNEELLAAMHQKTRYNIKVAAKHNVETKFASDLNSEESMQAINLLVATSSRQKYKSQTANYYKQLLLFFKNLEGAKDCDAHLFVAEHEGKPVASAIMIDHGTTRTYLFGGSDYESRNLMAPYALHWEAIQNAKSNAIQNYDWWGTETATGGTPGFVQFKLRWGGTQQFYAETRDIVLNSRWYFAYKALRKVNRLI